MNVELISVIQTLQLESAGTVNNSLVLRLPSGKTVVVSASDDVVQQVVHESALPTEELVPRGSEDMPIFAPLAAQRDVELVQWAQDPDVPQELKDVLHGLGVAPALSPEEWDMLLARLQQQEAPSERTFGGDVSLEEFVWQQELAPPPREARYMEPVEVRPARVPPAPPTMPRLVSAAASGVDEDGVGQA